MIKGLVKWRTMLDGCTLEILQLLSQKMGHLKSLAVDKMPLNCRRAKSFFRSESNSSFSKATYSMKFAFMATNNMHTQSLLSSQKGQSLNKSQLSFGWRHHTKKYVKMKLLGENLRLGLKTQAGQPDFYLIKHPKIFIFNQNHLDKKVYWLTL